MAEPAVAARDYPRLFRAMNEVLRVLLEGGDEEDALRRSFEDAARGFNAEKALFLLVEQQDSVRLRGSCVLGLSERQVEACERGESVPGVSSSVIRAVLRTREPRVIENPLFLKETDQTPALVGQDYSVLCAPVLDPVRDAVLAVLYFQNGRPDAGQAYREGDAEWLEGYASALGQAFAFHFQRARREDELQTLLDAGERPANAPELVGDSAHTQALLRQLHSTYIPAAGAPDPDPLFILGEKGTGKDLVARYLHAYSARRDRPFVAVNCAEITDELAAARFFGHRKGSFTGAVGDAPGFFRAAQGGVLLLDEIAELSPRAQGTLLRVLENRTIVPVGDTREARVDVQVVLATNRDPDRLVAEGGLRTDLYDRFRTQVLRLQPLRDRPWDVPALVHHFVAHHERRTRKKTLGVAPDSMRALVAYAWPGNVRELDRVCSLLITHTEPNARLDRRLLVRCYPDVLGAAPNPKAGAVLWEDVPMREAVRAFERELILSRLERHNWDVRAARESLRLPKTTFHRYAVELGLRAGDAEADPPVEPP
ncbi:MAG TPA: sigma 54-interacting transcriptional regulator [Vicinamibacteria bacterium]|nr:sigma 54-interacting transcriptional regulator [Vicinamibacteria bacterium]